MIWMIFMKILKKECNPNKKQKMLIVFDGITPDMLSNKKPTSIVTELFIRNKKLNIYLVFITQSYFAIPKNIRLTSTHYYCLNSEQTRTSTNCI